MLRGLADFNLREIDKIAEKWFVVLFQAKTIFTLREFFAVSVKTAESYLLTLKNGLVQQTVQIVASRII